MITTSGASVTVLKTAPEGPVRDRLFAQYDWCAKHRDDQGIVNVVRKHEDGYEMELLRARPNDLSARDVIEVLNRNVWGTLPPPNAFDEEKHLAYLTSLPFGTTLADTARTLTPYDDSVWCDTHGDPTFENVMRRAHTLVLTDPLPDRVLSGELPSVRALDLGKVLQSVIGYEYVKSGTVGSIHGLEFSSWTWDVVRRFFSVKEMHLAEFFLCVHVARLIPYQPDSQVDLWEQALEILLERL